MAKPKKERERNEWIVDWREARQMSQPQMAAKLGINAITLSRWERGAQFVPPYLRLALIGLDALDGKLPEKKPKKPSKK